MLPVPPRNAFAELDLTLQRSGWRPRTMSDVRNTPHPHLPPFSTSPSRPRLEPFSRVTPLSGVDHLCLRDGAGIDDANDHEAGDDQRSGHGGDEGDAAPAGGEFAADNPVLWRSITCERTFFRRRQPGPRGFLLHLSRGSFRAGPKTYLTLEIPPPPHHEHQDGNAQERRPQRFPQRGQTVGRRFVDRHVEPEELRHRDADGGEGQGGAEPGQECAFCHASPAGLDGALGREGYHVIGRGRRSHTESEMISSHTALVVELDTAIFLQNILPPLPLRVARRKVGLFAFGRPRARRSKTRAGGVGGRGGLPLPRWISARARACVRCRSGNGW